MEKRENLKGRESEDGQGKLDEEIVLVGKKRLGFARMGGKKREGSICKRYR